MSGLNCPFSPNILPRWTISDIRDFMLYIGPISSIFDFLTFFVLLNVFHASEQFFYTGWLSNRWRPRL